MRTLLSLVATLLLLAAQPAAAKDCDTRLNPSDGFNKLSKTLECLQNRIKALESKSGGAAFQPGVDMKKFKKIDQAKAGIFSFAVSGCKRNGTAVDCSIIITSTKDRELRFAWRDTLLYDDRGRKSQITGFKMNDQAFRLQYKDREQWISDIPVETTMTFNDVSDNAKAIAAIKIKSVHKEADWSTITLKNIPIR
jgi:hypothetical protein